jgi:hypothetical protein
MRGEGAGLAQQLVNQRGLAVVNVRDDGDIANGTDRHMLLEIKNKEDGF